MENEETQESLDEYVDEALDARAKFELHDLSRAAALRVKFARDSLNLLIDSLGTAPELGVTDTALKDLEVALAYLNSADNRLDLVLWGQGSSATYDDRPALLPDGSLRKWTIEGLEELFAQREEIGLDELYPEIDSEPQSLPDEHQTIDDPVEQSLQSHDTLLARIPSSIASPAFECFQHNPGIVHAHKAFETFDAAVRLLVAISANLGPEDNFPERLRSIQKMLGPKPPSLGTWIKALRDHLSILEQVEPSLANLLRRAPRKFTRLGEFIFNELAELRNDTIGHGSPTPEAYERVARQVMPELKMLLLVLASSNIQCITPAAVTLDNSGLLAYVSLLKGATFLYDKRPLEVEDISRLRPKHVYTLALPRPCDLYPLMTFDFCQECKRNQLFCLDSLSESSRQIKYRSFVCGHSMTEKYSTSL